MKVNNLTKYELIHDLNWFVLIVHKGKGKEFQGKLCMSWLLLLDNPSTKCVNLKLLEHKPVVELQNSILDKQK